MPLPPRIVVAGAGFAGLRAVDAVAGAAARGQCHLTLISDLDRFVYRPGLPGLALGRLRTADITRDLKRFRAVRAARLHVAPVTGIDPERHTVTAGGRHIPYDVLIVATGVVPDRSAVPGLQQYGHGVWDIPEALALRERLAQGARRVVVAADHTSPCVFGTYELAMMLARGAPRVTLVTTEYGPGGLIGPHARRALETLAARLGVEVHPGRRVAEVGRRGVLLDDGTAVDTDLAVVSPPPAVPALAAGLGQGAARTGLVLTRASLASVRWSGLFAAGAAAAAPPPVTAHVAEQMGLLAGRNALVAAGIRRGEMEDLEPSIASLLHFGRWYGLLHYLRPAGDYGPPRFRGGIGGWPLGALKDLFRRAYLAVRF